MSFLLPLGLLLAGLALLPILAHALFRGPARPIVFPAAHLVPLASASAKKRNRIEDRALLALRVLLLLALALLAASPLVRCSRLSLARPGGGSLAVALVLDDSTSMSVLDEAAGPTRLERSLDAARDLLGAARPGDVFSVVLAGKPARLLSPATSDLDSVREALARLAATDRATDLGAALALAESSLEKLPQPSRQVLVFSDFASEEELPAAQAVETSAPLEDLRTPFSNCALFTGQLRGKTASVELACTKGSPLTDRKVSVHAVTREPSPGQPRELGPALAEVEAREGQLRLPLTSTELPDHLIARLSPAPAHDQLPRDDVTELLREEDSITIGVRADPESAGTQTGTSTVIEIGLGALDPSARVQPLALLPDSLADLARLAALVIDDPPGFTPETQQALEQWLDSGGVALVLLGPRSRSSPLGAGFWPFLKQAPQIEPTDSPGARPGSGASHGDAWDTWTDLGAIRRAHFTADDGKLVVPWADGAPLVLERTHGQGLSWVTSLPASVDESDFALRPAFLALLERVIRESRLRRGAAASRVGDSWTVPREIEILGPAGPLALTNTKEGLHWAETALEGRYLLRRQSGAGNDSAPPQIRYATRDPAESLLQPQPLPATMKNSKATQSDAARSISREVALLALLLGALELALRAFWRSNPAAERRDSPEGAGSARATP